MQEIWRYDIHTWLIPKFNEVKIRYLLMSEVELKRYLREISFFLAYFRLLIFSLMIVCLDFFN